MVQVITPGLALVGDSSGLRWIESWEPGFKAYLQKAQTWLPVDIIDISVWLQSFS